MPRLEIDGMVIECETPEEVLAIMRGWRKPDAEDLSPAVVPPPPPLRRPRTEPRKDAVPPMRDSVGEVAEEDLTHEIIRQHFAALGNPDWVKAYDIVYEANGPIRLKEVCERLGKDARAGGSIRSAFDKVVKSLGVRQEAVFTYDHIRENRDRKQRLKATRYDGTKRDRGLFDPDGGEP